MLGEFQTILPAGNSTPWEKAVEQTSGERWDALDVDIIRRSRDPWTCPEHLLPFLAYDLSVDVWHDGMSVTDKRYVIARSIEMHRLKGTEEGLRQYIDLAGGELIRARVPPEGIYLDEGPTDAQRRAWLGRFAQIRIRRTAPILTYYEEDFIGGEGDVGCFLGGDEDDGTFLALYEPEPAYEALLWDDGEETVLTKRVTLTARANGTAVVEDYYMESFDTDAFLDEMTFDGNGDDVTFLDQPSPVIHFNHRALADTSHPVFYYVGIDGIGPFRFIKSEPETVREITVEGEFFLNDGCLDGNHFAANRAHLAMFQRWHIYDKARSGPSEVVEGSFLDDPDLLGLEPYHALIDAQVIEIHPLDAAILGDCFFDQAWLDQPDYAVRERVLDAAASAKALRDKFLVSTAHHRPIKWTDRLPWGFRWNQLIKE